MHSLFGKHLIVYKLCIQNSRIKNAYVIAGVAVNNSLNGDREKQISDVSEL